jgi:hypothetical protein
LTQAPDKRDDLFMSTEPPRVTYTQGGFWHWLVRGPRALRHLLGVVIGIGMAVTLQYLWEDPPVPIIRTVVLSAWLVLILVGIAYWHWRSGPR